MASLDRALALVQVHDPALSVAEDLHLDVPCARDQLFQEEAGVLEVGPREPLDPGTVRVDSILALATPATEGTQARANGFFERKSARDRGAGSSTFITPEEIARRRPQRVSDLLGAVAGVRLRFINGVAVPYGRDGHCIMNIWVNGTLIEGLYGQSAMNPQSYFRGGASSARPGGGDNEGIDGTINAMEADAVEIYPSPAETPPRFDSLRNQCGTIVIWTK